MKEDQLLIVGIPGNARVSDEVHEALQAYSGLLCAHAVEMARNGTPLADLVAFVVKDREGSQDLVGVARRSRLPGILQFEAAPPESRAVVEAFLAKTIPPTHIRLVVIDANGLSCLRLETIPMQPGGDA